MTLVPTRGVMAFECPHCQVMQAPHRHSQAEVSVPGSAAAVMRFAVGQCPNCLRTFSLVIEPRTNVVVDWQPRAVPYVTDLEGAPSPLLADFKEGQLALGYGLYKAAAVMFRRAVQSACLDKGAPKRDRIWAQIDWLEENHIVNVDLRDLAHEIRHFGNDGAHPDKDPLEDGVSKEEAEQAFEFARAFFDYVYAIPYRVALARQKRTVPALPPMS